MASRPAGPRFGAPEHAFGGPASKNHRTMQPVFRTDADGKKENAQHPVGRRAAANGKNAGDVWEIAPGATLQVHPRVYGICRHERAGKTGFFEECPALVANVAQGTPDLARSRHPRPRMAAVATRIDAAAAATVDAASASGARPPPQLASGEFKFPFPPPHLNFPPCIRLRFNSAPSRFIGMA